MKVNNKNKYNQLTSANKPAAKPRFKPHLEKGA